MTTLWTLLPEDEEAPLTCSVMLREVDSVEE